jgi:glycosyltransferase involved in cell wall biosynthesis
MKCDWYRREDRTGHPTIDVGIVIPAHNEARTVGDVAAACVACPVVSQVVVVDDGSSDDTAEVARQTGVEVVVLQPNRGKAMALHTGIGRLRAKVLVMLDADLIGFQPHHVTALAKPVLRGAYDVVIGSVGRGSVDNRRQSMLNYLSGQRCFPKRLWDMMLVVYPQILTMRFGVEMGLNWISDNLRLRRKAVDLDGVWDLFKRDKYGKLSGAFKRARMWAEIATTLRYLSRSPLTRLTIDRRLL